MQKNDVTLVYRLKKTKSGDPFNVGFPIRPCVTSLDGEFPQRRTWNSCAANPICMTIKSNEK